MQRRMQDRLPERGAAPPQAPSAQPLAQDLLRLITCGSVDDGKSTLIGRLLWEAQQVPEDQLQALRADSRRYGTQGDDIDYALLVDGLAAEREQGITIDVAYRYFSSASRRFIVADTPGHEQYTRNMVTAASTADAALLLVDARAGLQRQTRRHAYVASLLGVRHVLLAVNKMDLVDFREEVFRGIERAFADFARDLGFASLTAVPLSALRGDNLSQRSAHTPWYQGPTLRGWLDGVPARAPAAAEEPAAFPVQWVNRPDAGFRGLSGSVARGVLRVGDELRVTASGERARVAEILGFDGALPQAEAGRAVTLRLDREIDASRGDMLSHAADPLQGADQFEAVLVWMHADAGLVGRSYEIKLATQTAAASITSIGHRVNVDTLAPEPTHQLGMNDIAVCKLAATRALAFTPYAQSRELGAFILIDRFSHATVAAGMIRHALRRATNVHRQALSITPAQRERMNGHAAQVLWFTGLSGAGKSTLANALEVALHARGMRTYLLDGDNLRHGLNRDLGFTEADRVENIRRVAEVARLMADAGLVVLSAFISPYARDRAMAREIIGAERFVEVYVDTPLEVCEARDVKGLYRKARSGLIPNMTGVQSPYEAPEQPDLRISGSQGSPQAAVQQLLQALCERGALPAGDSH